MIPLNDYNKLLGACADDIRDEEIRQIRKEQYKLADVALDAWFDICKKDLKESKQV